MTWLRDQPGLVKHFRAGDRDALSSVYRAYVNAVLILLRTGFTTQTKPPKRVPGVTDTAQQMDCTQDIFIRAFETNARARYDGIRPYKPYLLRIAQNYRIDQLRRRVREVLDDSVVATAQDPAESPVETNSSEWGELSTSTRKYLSTLDVESREFVRLRFEQECSQQEVASTLSITRRRVRTLEGRVLRGLRRYLLRAQLDEDKSPQTHSPLVGEA